MVKFRKFILTIFVVVYLSTIKPITSMCKPQTYIYSNWKGSN